MAIVAGHWPRDKTVPDIHCYYTIITNTKGVEGEITISSAFQHYTRLIHFDLAAFTTVVLSLRLLQVDAIELLSLSSPRLTFSLLRQQKPVGKTELHNP